MFELTHTLKRMKGPQSGMTDSKDLRLIFNDQPGSASTSIYTLNEDICQATFDLCGLDFRVCVCVRGRDNIKHLKHLHQVHNISWDNTAQQVAPKGVPDHQKQNFISLLESVLIYLLALDEFECRAHADTHKNGSQIHSIV